LRDTIGLERLCAELGVTHRRPHHALADAEATAACFIALLQRGREEFGWNTLGDLLRDGQPPPPRFPTPGMPDRRRRGGGGGGGGGGFGAAPRGIAPMVGSPEAPDAAAEGVEAAAEGEQPARSGRRRRRGGRRRRRQGGADASTQPTESPETPPDA
jgi:hypothetical protein